MAELDTGLTVFITSGESTCAECGEDLGRHAWITLPRDKGALCLACADLDHLIFLPSGDAALTRRARKYSTLVAVVLRWSRARKRYERQGLLVEAEALEKAEQECLTDSEARARRREREAERRAELDRAYVERFAERVRQLFPGCPAGREMLIAEHPVRNTAVGLAVRRPPRISTKVPCARLLSLISATPRQTTMISWRKALTGRMPGRK
jgi:hypothetical protein